VKKSVRKPYDIKKKKNIAHGHEGIKARVWEGRKKSSPHPPGREGPERKKKVLAHVSGKERDPFFEKQVHEKENTQFPGEKRDAERDMMS